MKYAHTRPQRERMVQELQRQGIQSEIVLNAMVKVPREVFLAPAFRAEAYENAALPIGENQTISQPYVVALMTEALAVEKGHKVLEIGTGSGYQTAVLCGLGRRIYTVERFENLSVEAEKRLHDLGMTNFVRKVGDGSLGWPEQAPFDRIMVTAASPERPAVLLEQLAEGGVLVAPVGPQETGQDLIRYVRTGDTFHETVLCAVRFVPLVGKQGVAPEAARRVGK